MGTEDQGFQALLLSGTFRIQHFFISSVWKIVPDIQAMTDPPQELSVVLSPFEQMYLDSSPMNYALAHTS